MVSKQCHYHVLVGLHIATASRHHHSREFLSFAACVKYRVIPSTQGPGQGQGVTPLPSLINAGCNLVSWPAKPQDNITVTLAAIISIIFSARLIGLKTRINKNSTELENIYLFWLNALSVDCSLSCNGHCLFFTKIQINSFHQLTNM